MARIRSARPGVLLGALPRPVDRVGAREEEHRAPPLLVVLGGRWHDAAGVRDLPARPGVHPRPGRGPLRLHPEPLLHLSPPRAHRPRLTCARTRRDEPTMARDERMKHTSDV